MVELHLDRLPGGRSELQLDHVLVREDQVLQGQVVPGLRAQVSGRLDVDAMDQKILVHGDFTARRNLVCDRCGEPFDLDYPVSVEVLVYRQPGRGTDERMQEDDNWVIHQPGGIVDLTEALLEAVVLDQPLHVVHAEHADTADDPSPDRSRGAADDEIDPRWAALLELRGPEGADEGADTE